MIWFIHHVNKIRTLTLSYDCTTNSTFKIFINIYMYIQLSSYIIRERICKHNICDTARRTSNLTVTPFPTNQHYRLIDFILHIWLSLCHGTVSSLGCSRGLPRICYSCIFQYIPFSTITHTGVANFYLGCLYHATTSRYGAYCVCSNI